MVYDLGCAHGDHTQKLSDMGAMVHGIDNNQDLLNVAKEREIQNAQFSLENLNDIPFDFSKRDGIWTSFVMAYFTELEKTLNNWKNFLKPNGWIAITEMTGLLNHLPIFNKYSDDISEFYVSSLARKNYDFKSASKIEAALKNTGFEVLVKREIDDRELSFEGAAADDIVEAWDNRLQRMGGFKHFMGESFSDFKKDFLVTLKNDEHISECKVIFFLARLK